MLDGRQGEEAPAGLPPDVDSAQKTINGTMVPLREMLRHAVEWGYLETSPAAMVKPLRLESREREILSPDELAAVLEAAEASTP